MTHWERWHRQYDDPGGPMAARLDAVRGLLSQALDRAADGPVRLLSLCAGDGRDVLPVLAGHPRGMSVTGRLVEMDPALVGAARLTAPPGVKVLEADAGTTAACVGAVPADVLLLCGIFGNVPNEDIERTVRAVPTLLATGGTVIWTRHRRAPDLTPAIRSWIAEAGIAEIAFISEREDSGWAVGAGTFLEAGTFLGSERRLFDFRESDRQ